MLPSSIMEPYRFTPTRVGTSSEIATSTLPTAVHPHTRGDIT